jgi:hypothetical protein
LFARGVWAPSKKFCLGGGGGGGGGGGDKTPGHCLPLVSVQPSSLWRQKT